MARHGDWLITVWRRRTDDVFAKDDSSLLALTLKETSQDSEEILEREGGREAATPTDEKRETSAFPCRGTIRQLLQVLNAGQG